MEDILSDTILRDDRGGVTWLSVNRPDKLNVLNSALMTELTQTLRDLASDQDLRAVVITGAGDRSFVGGRTRWLLMTGEMIDAATAHQWGFVEFLTKPEDLDAVLDRSVQAIVESGPHAIRTQKTLIQSWESLAPDDAIAATIPVFGDSFKTGEPQAMLGGFLARKAKG